MMMAPLASHRSISSIVRTAGASVSSNSCSDRLVRAAKPKYGGATDWPVVTAATNSSSLIGWAA